jgi:H+-transporting ATPase
MPPIGWGWALVVWGYSLPFFLLNDRIKILAYRILDPIKAVKTAATALVAKIPLQPGPVLSTAQRAYELYVGQGRREGHATQDWLQAESDVAKKQA